MSNYETPLEIQVVNISSGGLCISTTELFRDGAILEIDITLESTLYELISATIIWSMKKENIYHYGMKIKNITGKLSMHIDKIAIQFSTSV